MTDEAPNEPETSDTGDTTTTSGSNPIPFLLGLLAAFAWVVTVFQMFEALGEYNDQRDSFDISAPQVAQIAGEFVVAVLPWMVGALAVTSLALLAGVARRR